MVIPAFGLAAVLAEPTWRRPPSYFGCRLVFVGHQRVLHGTGAMVPSDQSMTSAAVANRRHLLGHHSRMKVVRLFYGLFWLAGYWLYPSSCRNFQKRHLRDGCVRSIFCHGIQGRPDKISLKSGGSFSTTRLPLFPDGLTGGRCVWSVALERPSCC